ncbi:ATP-dependent nuclease [Acutalibacter caecimuris]|uniref:ATP-dependent nuclease n=1 Tax=Acutalibacter caecimuris TaxID=3093657 RepID=UPI002AC93212|nr:AAA family ATPase [Acutalibacter sp. M00118]
MFLSGLQVEGFRLFKDATTIKLHRGLNLFVGENGCGKSSVIDAIRILLNESEFFHRGLREEDFYQEYGVSTLPTLPLSISGIFADLNDAQKIEYLTWLTPRFNAKLNVEYQYNVDSRRMFKPKRWGGNSCNSIFDWEPLDDIQCVYLPALRDAERSLRSGRGSRLSRFITNLSADELAQRRKNHEKMPLENDVFQFNQTAADKEDIKRANELINRSLKNAVGTIFGQSTRIQFNELSYERIVESLQILFSKSIGCTELESFRSLSENSLGYNNLIYIATILAEFEGLKDRYTTPRILLVEELEAHLHPQLQIKLLKYLSQQALDYDIQVIITTHSTTLASVVPIDQIISVH